MKGRENNTRKEVLGHNYPAIAEDKDTKVHPLQNTYMC